MADATEDFSDKLKSALAFAPDKAISTPAWLAFGAVATAGVAWWWLTRWMRPSTPETVVAA